MPWATGKRKKTGGHFVGPKRHQLRQPTPTFKDISVYCIGSQQWPPTFKQVSHLGIHFFIVGFFEKMMLKKCLKIHTHTPSSYSQPGGIDHSNCITFRQHLAVKSMWNNTEKVKNQNNFTQARGRDASHPKSDFSQKMFATLHDGGQSSCPCSHIDMKHVLVCVCSLVIIWLLFVPMVWFEP